MSESRSDATPQVPVTPPAGRYDDAETGSALTGKVMAGFLVVLVGALLVAGVVTMYRLNATPDITGELFGVTVVDDGRTDLVVNVTRDDPATPVYCIVRAQDQTKGEVGRREVYVPPSESGTVQVETSVATFSRGFTGDVYGCGDDVPEYLRR
ncbi:DUF4307 domain-containing protein [Dietzia sp. UBA5065]|jgi:uncharacterized protein (DUF58 family)|uniref:DUF4307 domain-containing protein n=1 Tax=Dietzia sp. UBA5065 TaxID=1946422 RepID=UPI0025BBAF7C|nr:DUF4307 domain-containing protein [Dietzia sp. UBA5065]HMT49361.1 DUF4307 domain-containing protein [Dietzia sp.]